MENFKPSKETLKAAERYIEKKNGKIKVDRLPNDSEDFDINKASKKMSNFANSELFYDSSKNW